MSEHLTNCRLAGEEEIEQMKRLQPQRKWVQIERERNVRNFKCAIIIGLFCSFSNCRLNERNLDAMGAFPPNNSMCRSMHRIRTNNKLLMVYDDMYIICTKRRERERAKQKTQMKLRIGKEATINTIESNKDNFHVTSTRQLSNINITSRRGRRTHTTHRQL